LTCQTCPSPPLICDGGLFLTSEVPEPTKIKRSRDVFYLIRILWNAELETE